MTSEGPRLAVTGADALRFGVDGALAGALTFPAALLGFVPAVLVDQGHAPRQEFWGLVAFSVPAGAACGVAAGLLGFAAVRVVERRRGGRRGLVVIGPIVAGVAAIGVWSAISVFTGGGHPVPRNERDWRDLAVLTTMVLAGVAPIWVGWLVARWRDRPRAGWLAASVVWAAGVSTIGAVLVVWFVT